MLKIRYRKSSFKPPVPIKPPYSNKPCNIALNFEISSQSLTRGLILKYTVLVRGLIRVPCKGCSNGRDLLKQELEIINNNEEDPFKLAQPTEEDREAAHPAILLRFRRRRGH